ncbi:type II toxin-antitoxin system VapB family antitoxin [Agrobacterium radiobacter]|uniref:type II toxin-antitoxin system VapB family antitoxin n=1 Tax=Agrobacterium radiobacter TaxID=362 RepID=UPI003F87E18A
MEITGLSTVEATVGRTLREFVRVHWQRRALEELRGIGWEGNLDGSEMARARTTSSGQ